VPRKPWEKDASAATEEDARVVKNALDLEFPPVEEAEIAAATAESS
jgi:hypothetical protein